MVALCRARAVDYIIIQCPRSRSLYKKCPVSVSGLGVASFQGTLDCTILKSQGVTRVEVMPQFGH